MCVWGGGGGGAEKVLAMLKWGHTKFWGRELEVLPILKKGMLKGSTL